MLPATLMRGSLPVTLSSSDVSQSPPTRSAARMPVGTIKPNQRTARSPPSLPLSRSLPNSATQSAAQTTRKMTPISAMSTQASAVMFDENGPAGSSTGGGQPLSALARSEREEVGRDIAGVLVRHGGGGHRAV